MQLSYYEKVSHNTHEISQDTPIWDKYSVKYTQLNIQFGSGLAHKLFLISIYQISRIKMSKVPFCKLKTSLSGNFISNLRTLQGFCQVHFYDFVANSA